MHRLPGLLALVAVVVISTTQLSSPALAQSPFQALGGTWGGAGSLSLANGERERLRCRAYYTPRERGANMGMAIRCASASYKIELRSRLAYNNGLVSGSWRETSFNQSGSIRGRASSSRLTLQIQGGVSGSITVAFAGQNQSISVQTNGSELRGVSISLSRQ